MLITETAALVAFCDDVGSAPYVSVDTEFVRERTYYAELALIQVAYGPHAAAIDPLADGLDMAPLKRLLLNPDIVKVFHSGTEDLELLLEAFGEVPVPAFDTQIAASMCGSDAQVGYARLVHDRLGITLDKGSQRTNWSRRPLTPRQLAYALADVTHLCTLYEQLLVELADRDRTPWVAEEMAAMTDSSRFHLDPRDAWRRIRIRRPTRRALAILRELAAWRESRARTRDLPRPWVLKNDVLVQLAEQAPTTLAELRQLSAVEKMGRRWKDAGSVVEIINKALAQPESTWPEVQARPPAREQDKLINALRSLLKERCEGAEIAPTVVATRREIELLATQDDPDIQVLKGWRRAFFGEAALALKAG